MGILIDGQFGIIDKLGILEFGCVKDQYSKSIGSLAAQQQSQDLVHSHVFSYRRDTTEEGYQVEVQGYLQ